jgi:hypothetical protein
MGIGTKRLLKIHLYEPEAFIFYVASYLPSPFPPRDPLGKKLRAEFWWRALHKNRGLQRPTRRWMTTMT